MQFSKKQIVQQEVMSTMDQAFSIQPQIIIQFYKEVEALKVQITVGRHQHVKKNIQLQGTTGLQNYSKLKPCKQISEKTLRNLEQCFNTANKQTNFINKVFATFVQNSSHKFKQKNSRFFQKHPQIQKQNILSIQGKCVSFSTEEKRLPKFTQQQNYFKTNCFQPVLKTKQNSKLMKKSRKYFLAKV